jgi:DnaJ-class molecular chaperone
MPNDPYDLLGLTKTASADDIKKAYRKLARSSHPDLHPDDAGAAARFQAISGAYDILKDPATRASYDAGEIDGQGVQQPPRQYYRDFASAGDPRYQPSGGFGSNADPADIFAEILRNRAYPQGGDFAAQGGDLRFRLDVAFLDAARGGQMRITLPDGPNLAVKIPQGAEDGQTLRLRGKGRAGFGGGPAGDVLIILLVRPHPVFQRDGHDIFLTLPITIDEAVLGGKVTAPTIDGPVGVTIPAGARSGQILRLRGRGVALAGRKMQGDQRITLQIVTPPDADGALRDFLAQWRKTHAYDPRADLMKEAAL